MSDKQDNLTIPEWLREDSVASASTLDSREESIACDEWDTEEFSDSPILDCFIRDWLRFREGNRGMDFGPIDDVVDAFCSVVEESCDPREGWLELACELALYRDAVVRLRLSEIIRPKCEEFLDRALHIAALLSKTRRGGRMLKDGSPGVGKELKPSKAPENTKRAKRTIMASDAPVPIGSPSSAPNRGGGEEQLLSVSITPMLALAYREFFVFRENLRGLLLEG